METEEETSEPQTAGDWIAPSFVPIEWESIGASCCSTATDSHPRISIDAVGPNFLVMDQKDIITLKDQYRIICSPFNPASAESGHFSPGYLLPEQAQVLVENGIARIRQLSKLQGEVFVKHDSRGESTSMEPPMKKRRKRDSAELDLREMATKMVMGRKIKAEKKKEFGINASADALRVRKADEISFKGILEEEEICAAMEEIRENREKVPTEELTEIKPLIGAQESCYENDENPTFPSTLTYRNRLTTFRDLWRKGFYLTAGTKFGCDFLAYQKPPGVEHSRFMVVCLDSSSDMLKPLDLISTTRVCSQVKKKLLLAVVSSGTTIPYYIKVGWWKGDK